MNDQAFKRRKMAMGIVAILLAGVIGALAYNAGVAHGIAMTAAMSGAVEQGGNAAAAAYHHGYAPYGWHPWGFGFGFPFFPLFGVLFFFFALRVLFWGGPRRGCYGRDGYGVPPRFEDWHRRAHERMKDEPPAPNV
jgi:hypothetical protein